MACYDRPNHTENGRPAMRIYTLLTRGHMNRAHRAHTHGRAGLTAKLALALFVSVLIAATFMAVDSGPAPILVSHAAPLQGRPQAASLNPGGTVNLSMGFGGNRCPVGNVGTAPASPLAGGRAPALAAGGLPVADLRRGHELRHGHRSRRNSGGRLQPRRQARPGHLEQHL